MPRAFVGLGSNLGDRAANLRKAVASLREAPGVAVKRVSSFVETRPWGGPPQPDFLNAAAQLETHLAPRDLLQVLLTIEARLGRARGERWGPRVIDLDLLLYDDETVSEPDLRVPHPLMHERLFALGPLCEIAPDAVHPVLGKDIRTLLAERRARRDPAQTDG